MRCLEGLGKIIGSAELDRELDVRDAASCRKDEHGDGGEIWPVRHEVENSKAIQLWHVEIKDHRRGTNLAETIDGGGAVAGAPGFVSSDFEPGDNEVQQGWIIVDHHDARP